MISPGRSPAGSRQSGVTLVEMTIAVAVLAIIFFVAPPLIRQISHFFRQNMVSIEVRRDARDAVAMIDRELRQAQAGSITIDQLPGQPPHSRIVFNRLIKNGGVRKNVSYYQSGGQLYVKIDTAPAVKLADGLRYIAFCYPRTSDQTVLSVFVVMEKPVFGGRTVLVRNQAENIRVMNS
jgi:prepilin-type N-terminal cleavage/methylation domain-containing protein